MSTIPHFLNIWSALAAAAVAIPALLILYFLKLRRREMTVPSTLLWKKAIQDLQVNAPFQKLRRNLLLLLQLLLLLALLLAFSRPVTNYRPPPGQVSVLLIDRSASMSARDVNGRTRLDEAKRRAKELVDSMRKDSAAMVIAFDDGAETVQSFTTDQVALRNAIDAIQPTDRRTRLRLAYELADASMAFNPDQLRANVAQADVYLFSDGRAEDAKDVGLHGKLIFEKVGTDAAANVGIVSLDAKRNYEQPTQVQVFARLVNYGPEPVDVPVQLKVDGQIVEVNGQRSQYCLLLPDRWNRDQKAAWESQHGKARAESASFELDLTDAATVSVEQTHKSGDVLSADDVAQVIVPPPKQLSVLLVTDGNYFAELLLHTQHLKSPDVMTPASYEEKVPTQYDVILFDRYSPQKLPEAGSFIYFGCVPPDDLKTPGPKITAAKDPTGNYILLHEQWVLDWKREHPILRDCAMNKVYAEDSLKLNVPLDAEVLVDGLKGPLIVLARDGKRTNLVIGFDVLPSNWPFEPSFPMFMHHALEYLAAGTDMGIRQSFEPGATPQIPRANLQRGGTPITQFTLSGPGGFARTIRVPETGDVALPPLDRVGVYATEPPIPQYEKIAVNLLDASESNVLPESKAPGGDIKTPIVADEKDRPSRREWWWYLVAFIALPLLFVEWWVYTRRVHL